MVFKISPPPPPTPPPHPPQTILVGLIFSPPRIFLPHSNSHRRSSWYPTPIPTTTDFSSTALPPSSLRKTTHLPVELRGGQKFILESSQWKISDIRMIDSSEFSEFTWGGHRTLYFAYASFGWFCRWIQKYFYLEIKNKRKRYIKKKRINE